MAEDNLDSIPTMNQVFEDETIKNLSEGFLSLYKPNLENTRAQLEELVNKQNILLEQMHNENLKVSWTKNSVDVLKMFDTIATYHVKLNNVKKDMRILHDKNIKLKKRALRLQQHKEKVEHLHTQHREMELKREQDLIAKPSNA